MRGAADDAMAALELPPLLTPVRVQRDPFTAAVAAARTAPDPGRFTYADDPATLAAAVEFAPEVPLAEAVGAVFAVALGLADTLEALGPPELAVNLRWPDRVLVNGALCATLRAAADPAEPDAVPDWLVVGVEAPLRPRRADPGTAPDETALWDEGFSEEPPGLLLESLARHTLVWVHQLTDEGIRPLHAAWIARCRDIGKPVGGHDGMMIGLDERGGLLLETRGRTELVPLTTMIA